ncbi:LRAT domain-containing protein [Tumidithrix helvetica PCC 7403]|uniref:lecithin retinol acyltransferase family protein n=1 Tax=Tumidithrix helvetica TaxID=3457545 RepID=UPI003CB688DF
MELQIGDILSVELVAHTRHFFVYIGNGKIVEWGPWDGTSWMGSKGHVFTKELFRSGLSYKLPGSDGELKKITLEQSTGASKTLINQRIKEMTTGIDYHLGHRNCEHFAYYVTGYTGYSKQSVSHMFTDHDPFTSNPMIHNLNELRDELLRSKYCGIVGLSRGDFEGSVLAGKMSDGHYAYHYSHPLGGQHLYVTTIPKSEDFEASYNSILLAYYGAFFGRGEILSIVRKLRGC